MRPGEPSRLPWTREELKALARRLSPELAGVEAAMPDVRPLPPLNEAEAMELFRALMDAAATRPLTRDECFFGGQVLAAYRSAILGEALRGPGRYMVVSEQDINRLMAETGLHRPSAP